MSEISLHVGDATLTMEYIGREYDSFREYRPRYQYTITPDDLAWQYVGDDISGPLNGTPDTTSAMSALLSFLSACAESRAYGAAPSRIEPPRSASPATASRCRCWDCASACDGTGENATLFPEHVGEWSEQYSDEINLARYEIDPDN